MYATIVIAFLIDDCCFCDCIDDWYSTFNSGQKKNKLGIWIFYFLILGFYKHPDINKI